MTNLPPNPSRDDILAALRAVPESNQATRVKLMRRFAVAPPRPAIRMRHGARPGKIETFVWRDDLGETRAAIRMRFLAAAAC